MFQSSFVFGKIMGNSLIHLFILGLLAYGGQMPEKYEVLNNNPQIKQIKETFRNKAKGGFVVLLNTLILCLSI